MPNGPACENMESNRFYFTLPYKIARAQVVPQKASIEYSRVDNSARDRATFG